MPGCGAISDGVDGAVLLAKKQAVRCCDWSGWCLDGWVGRAISEGRDVVMRGRSIVSTLMEMLHVLYIHLPYCRHSSSSSSPPRAIAPLEGAVLIIWWVVEEIINHNATWWQFSTESLAMVLSQVSLVDSCIITCV